MELTVALHYVYNTPIDKLIWDVGHQIYPHKILTGRKESLKTVRQFGGLSGFPKREESQFDLYNTGHAGTSISQLLGEAIARDKLGLNHKCVCVIGDASIASGMALEALNHGGNINTECLVVLNDNDMSISHNVGALNKYFNSLVSSPAFSKWLRWWYTFLMMLPILGPTLKIFSKKIEHAFKDIFTPGGFFVNLGFRYIGPVDGHNVIELVKVLQKINKTKDSTILHVYTQKGSGYIHAENNPIKYHSVSVFNKSDGSFENKVDKNEISFSNIVGETLLEIAKRNDKVVAITPAMIEGSGLRPLYNVMPERVYDVGIAEQHCVSFSGALAAGGLIPYLCIYSTFLNRGIDQLIQDVALMNFPVRIIIDRAGCVGADGETHQGLYDLGVLLSIPNIHVYACSNGIELKSIIEYMENFDRAPIAVRFPKASCLRSSLPLTLNNNIHNKENNSIVSENKLIQNNVSEKNLTDNKLNENLFTQIDQTNTFYNTDYSAVIENFDADELAVIAIGTMWEQAKELEKLCSNIDVINSETNILLNKHTSNTTIKIKLIGLRWIRPLNLSQLTQELSVVKNFIIIEDSYIHSSAAAYILQLLPSNILAKHLHTFAFPEGVIEHGTRDEILDLYGLSSKKILRTLISYNLLSENKLYEIA